jgi:hypothetical protein
MSNYPKTFICEGESRWRAVFLAEGTSTWIEREEADGTWRVYSNREWCEGEMRDAGFEVIE